MKKAIEIIRAEIARRTPNNFTFQNWGVVPTSEETLLVLHQILDKLIQASEEKEAPQED